MSDALQKLWSDNLNAPVISYGLYIYEKLSLAGNLVSSILYGTRKKFPPARPSDLAHLVYSRDPYHGVLPIYDCPV